MSNKCCHKGDFSAGFKLLTKFQNQWEQIHANSENTVLKAKQASIKLSSLEHSCTKRINALDNFIEGYKSLAKLEDQIKNIDNDLKALESCFLQIEDYLIVLTNHNENIKTNYSVQRMDADYELKVQEEKSRSDARREKLKMEHLRRVGDFERQQQYELEERRKILEQAFEEEKSRYLERNKRI